MFVHQLITSLVEKLKVSVGFDVPATIIVAGSEGLLGNEISLSLEELGCRIIRLDQVLGHDLSDEGLVKELVQANRDAGALINAFALNPQPQAESDSLGSISLNSFADYMRINVETVFSVSRAYSSVCQDGSSILNFGSIYALKAPPERLYEKNFQKHIGYSVSKAGTLGLSSYLAAYLAPRVRVNTIVPGGVYNRQASSFETRYSSSVPMQRMMDKEEILGAVIYLISAQASYTTGAILNVDGGWSCW